MTTGVKVGRPAFSTLPMMHLYRLEYRIQNASGWTRTLGVGSIMQIKGVTRSQVESCASMHQMRAIDAYARPGWVGVCLRPVGEYYRRTALSGRRVNAVCWHGHARFLRELFSRWPDARIRTTNMGGRPHHVTVTLVESAPARGLYCLSEWLDVSLNTQYGSMLFGYVTATDLCTHDN